MIVTLSPDQKYLLEEALEDFESRLDRDRHWRAAEALDDLLSQLAQLDSAASNCSPKS